MAQETGPRPGTPSPEEIRQALAQIVSSPAFHASKRCPQFLEYICGKALAGDTASLKERAIAVELFGRSPHADLGQDTIVRVTAREVRKRLAQYYGSTDAKVRIELPPGTYAPEFRTADEPVVAPARRKRFLLVSALGIVLLCCLVLALAPLWRADRPAPLFEVFWAPVVEHPRPLLVVVAHPIVYYPPDRVLRVTEGLSRVPGYSPTQLPREKMEASEMVPVVDQFVGFGDMVAGVHVATMLARQRKPIRLVRGSTTAFADIQGGPAMLIGAVTNRWTMELQRSWEFQFVRLPDRRLVIEERGTRRQWAIPDSADGSGNEDYILINRLRNTVTGGSLFVAAGIRQFGTEAAGCLLADPERLGAVLAKIPQGWESRNLQVVLHVAVLANEPARPEVVASRVW
jgi:hypothetical protein